ncbi:hypothetical protein [Pseudomonas sp. LBUM920]|uniref:hypothetical protein n=1 Tax=Pseudomonas sp. LBUM920 TaxID=2126069 RepID=UPI000F584588|nr:hypothetical protein [Pseudomonas sp. LBUM920]AZF64563.1 hypothetical protein C4J83_3576 [Pseudomonas sp. LBUM920]
MRQEYNYGNAEKFNREKLYRLASRAICMVIVALPIISFLMSIVGWLSFGIDLPFLDDMRQYETGSAGRMDFDYISQPANDTYYSVGLFLDSLAFRVLAGNSIAYQAISLFFVLGSILLMQWNLLGRVVENRTVKAIAFSTTIFMLQPDSYWGWQNMAYHQALPLVCSLGILSVALSRLDKWVSGCLIAVMALLSGFSYTSGAFANLSIFIGFVIFFVIAKNKLSDRIKVCAAYLLLPTVITVFAQLWVILAIQHGTHRPDAPMAYPWEPDFWLFMLGKVARSLMLPSQYPKLSLTLSVMMMVIATFFAARSLFDFIFNKGNNKVLRVAFIYLCLYGVCISYLMIVSAGRANLRPDFISAPIDVFVYGYGRFHFFWLTILWPWLVMLGLMNFKLELKSRCFQLSAGAVSLIALMALVLCTTIMSHADFYKKTMVVRESIFKCLQNGLDNRAPFECSDLHPGLNMQKVFYISREAGASYTRLINARPVPIGSNTPPPIFRLTSDNGLVEFKNSHILSSGGDGVFIDSQNDPMLIISIGHDELMRNCSEIEVNGSYDIGHQDLAQLFYLPSGVTAFSEELSSRVSLQAGKGTFSLSARSSTGFSSLLRFDPTVGATKIRLMQLEVRCTMDHRSGTKMH